MRRADLPELLVLRHGQTEWNLSGRFQGAKDSALTDLGLAQARRQGEILAGLPGVAGHDLRCSPQPRAWRTAEIALAAIGAKALADPRLAEISLGDWEGLTRAEVAARFPIEAEDSFFWMDAAPGGEGHAAVAARVASLLAGLTGPTVLVTHGIAASHIRGQALGLSMQDIAGLRGEQGVVYRLRAGVEERLT